MRQSIPRSLISTVALLPSVFAQIIPLMPGNGMDPMCMDDGLQTIIYEYPVFYSTVYQSVGTIFSFLGGTNSLVINNPGQTIVTSTVLTTTVVATSTTTQTVTTPGSGGTVVTATLGAGIPSGTVSLIPSNSPFALAFALSATGGIPDGYAAGGGLGAITDANFFFLEAGELPSTNGGKVGRNSTQSVRKRQNTGSAVAKIEATVYFNDITTNFFLVDGVLNWESPDLGPATFYACADGLYAGFPDTPDGACAEAMVGAVSKVAVDIELEGAANTTSPASTSSMGDITSDGGDGTSGSATTSASDGETTSDTSGTTTDDSSASTTSSDAAPTTTSGGDEGVCPGQSPDDDYFGYSVYCGQIVDPVNADDDLIPGGQTDVASFDDCTVLCDDTDGCTGLSYYAPDSTCYIHQGESQAPRDAVGYDGAVKNAETGGDSSSTTSTMSQDSSTTDGGEVATTSTSGMSTSDSAASSSMTSDSLTSATGSAGSVGASSVTSSFMASGSSASATGSAGFTGVSSGASSSLSGTSSTDSAGTSSTTSKSPYSNSTSATGGTTTAASSTMSGMKSTTSSSPASTTSADLCPSTPSGTIVGSYQIYCGYVVDPVDNADSFPQINPVSFQGCLDACTANSTCVGLSYIEGSTTCYLHKGQNAAPAARAGWRGAAKVGAGGPSSTTTMTMIPTTSSGTSSSGASTSALTTSSSTSSPGTVTPNGSTSSSPTTSSGGSSSSTSESSSSSSSSSALGTTTSGVLGVTTPGVLGTTSSSSSPATTSPSTSSSPTSSSSTTSGVLGVTTPGVLGTTSSSTSPATTSSSTSAATTSPTTSSTTTSTSTSAATTSAAATPVAIRDAASPGPQDSNSDSVEKAQCLKNCPTDKTKVQHGYNIVNGERWGGLDISNSVVADFATCVNLCTDSVDATTKQGNCVSVNYQISTKHCYLHSDCHPTSSEATDTDWTSAERVRADCP